MTVAVGNPKQLQKHIVEIWCDGACSNNGKSNAVGGWCCILTSPTFPKVKEFSGKVNVEENPTNNRMELLAAIEGLRKLNSQHVAEVTIHSDSKYLIGGMNGNARNVNLDLWEILDKLAAQFTIEWKWHRRNSHELLAQCDKLAKAVIG